LLVVRTYSGWFPTSRSLRVWPERIWCSSKVAGFSGGRKPSGSLKRSPKPWKSAPSSKAIFTQLASVRDQNGGRCSLCNQYTESMRKIQRRGIEKTTLSVLHSRSGDSRYRLVTNPNHVVHVTGFGPRSDVCVSVLSDMHVIIRYHPCCRRLSINYPALQSLYPIQGNCPLSIYIPFALLDVILIPPPHSAASAAPRRLYHTAGCSSR
jgi:hypothetical protein